LTGQCLSRVRQPGENPGQNGTIAGEPQTPFFQGGIEMGAVVQQAVQPQLLDFLRAAA
jgi:hypothetical protein